MSVMEATRLTPEDLLTLPNWKHLELVRGKLVEHEMSHFAVWVATTIIFHIRSYLVKNPIGDVFSEGASYQCFPDDPLMVRRPDVSFIRAGRLPQEQFDHGHARIAPDLAVEVISPKDLHYEVTQKLNDYFSAGIPLVWLVDPKTRTVTVYRQGGDEIVRLQESDTLTGDDVLPGFSCSVADLFPATKTAAS